VDLTHPLGVAAGQIVVHGDDMDAPAGEAVEIAGQGGDQRLALAGAHLGDAAAVQHDAAHHLHVVVSLAQGALGRLPDGGEGLGEQVVQGLAILQALAVVAGLGPELGVGEPDQLGLDGADLLHQGHDALDDAIVVGAKELLEGICHRGRGALQGGAVAECKEAPDAQLAQTRICT
jgi:hypothetical protein